MAKKKSYRDLEREIERLRYEYEPAIKAFRESAEQVLNEVVEESAHALLGQAILEAVVKQVAYKEITAFEAKQWLETKWHKRHEVTGSYEERSEWLGLNPNDMEQQFKDIDGYVNKATGDRAIKLFIDFFEANKMGKK